MADVHELRPKTPDSEKITVNLGFIDLGRMDLMVRDGFYANRADFIRTAVRNQLERQDDAVRQSVARRQLKLGLSHYTRQDLEAARDAGTPLHIQVLGLATIASDVTPELARAAIASVQVLGAFQASPAVKAALADRTDLNISTNRPSARHPACIDAGQESTIMNAFSKIDMGEVTRLTQAGKLAEAMALLQGHTASSHRSE